jgi:hypothetical protein
MTGASSRGSGVAARIDRRTWLTAALTGCLAHVSRAAESNPPDADPEVDRLEDLAWQRGLGPLGASKSRQYLAIGDAPDRFRLEALQTCVAFQREFLDHFGRKGFVVAAPLRRLTIVTLAHIDSYARMMGAEAGEAECGCYSPRTNRLFLLDPATVSGDLYDGREQQTQRAIAHEATHQLIYNTGLLRRPGDAPRAITEGLATYAELRKQNGRGGIGQMNFQVLNDLWRGIHRGMGWLSLARLLEEDSLFDNRLSEEWTPLAYAQSWLLVHYLMTSPMMLPRFRSYLECQRARGAARFRLVDAHEHLGDLARLETAVQRHARSLGRR